MGETIEANRDVIKGVKLRATVDLIELIENLGIDAVETAKQVASAAGLPVVIHLGIDAGETITDDALDAFTRQMLSLLDAGDVLTHAFTKKRGGVIKPDGRVMPGLREAVERGVVLDVASAIGHLDFEVARKGIEQELLPTTLSTDFTIFMLNGPVPFSLPVLMSQFLALGQSLPQVIEMATVNPARVLGEKGRRGSLAVGLTADISLFELVKGEYLFVDSKDGNILSGEHLLVPKWTLKRGAKIAAGHHATSYAQWSDEARQLIAGRKE